MLRRAPSIAVLVFASACTFEAPPGVGPGQKDADPIDRGSAELDAGEPDALADEDTGTMDVAPGNRTPIALADSATTAAATPIEIEVLTNDTDPDGDALTVISLVPPQNGTAVMSSADRIRYTPTGAFAGIDRFGYRVADGRGGEASAAVRVLVEPARLALLPMSAETNLNSRTNFTAMGGVPPYTYTVAAGTGTVDANGVFFSDGLPGSARIVVEDSAANSATATVTFGNGDLFFLGGVSSSGDEEEVYRSGDGINWQTLGTLPIPLYLFGSVVFDDRLVLLGGRNQIVEASDVVRVSANGTSWTSIGNLPRALRGNSVVVFQQQLFLLGGRDSASVNRDEVYSSPDGVNWTFVGRLPAARAFGSAFVFGGELWYAGGESAAIESTIWSSSDGANWMTRGPLPAPREFVPSAVHDGQLWIVGGSENGDAGVLTVWRSSDGDTFSDATALPVTNGGATALSWRSALWVAGGGDGLASSQTTRNEVLTMAPNGDWVSAGTLPAGRYHGALLIYAP